VTLSHSSEKIIHLKKILMTAKLHPKAITCLPIIILLFCCAGYRPFIPPSPLPHDHQDIAKPKIRDVKWLKDGFNKTFTMQFKQNFTLSRQLAHLFGKYKEASNVDALDEVANSSWFTNRNAIHPMTAEQISSRCSQCDTPDVVLPLEILTVKAGPITPRFYVKDRKGYTYELVFDPPGCPELATGAGIVSNCFFHAAGYQVPQNFLLEFSPDDLILTENSLYCDEMGRVRSCRRKDFDIELGRIERRKDKRIRALAIKAPLGDPLGGFYFEGIRQDDPNDFIPHEDRRELRGMGVLCNWLNFPDAHAAQTMDVYVTENANHFIRHYMMDFSSSLGSNYINLQDPHKGHENFIDPNNMIWRIATLGLFIKPWEKAGMVNPSVGIFDSANLNPKHIKPTFPNVAFENCTSRDNYWGTKIVTSFTDAQIAAVVAAGRYSDPEAQDYLVKTLKERRDKIGRYWFGKVNPLDLFTVIGKDGKVFLEFVDLGVERNLWTIDQSFYRHEIYVAGHRIFNNMLPSHENAVDLEVIRQRALSNNQQKELIEVRLYTKRGETKGWSQPVCVFLQNSGKVSNLDILGLLRK
jgi:hypothetical protein